LLAAEMLNIHLDPTLLHRHVQQVFDYARKPSDIHREVARLPFCLDVTTNFDSLLEIAQYPRAKELLWTEPEAILDYLRRRSTATPPPERVVVKMHGSTRLKQSLRLTRTHYRDLL